MVLGSIRRFGTSDLQDNAYVYLKLAFSMREKDMGHVQLGVPKVSGVLGRRIAGDCVVWAAFLLPLRGQPLFASKRGKRLQTNYTPFLSGSFLFESPSGGEFFSFWEK